MIAVAAGTAVADKAADKVAEDKAVAGMVVADTDPAEGTVAVDKVVAEVVARLQQAEAGEAVRLQVPVQVRRQAGLYLPILRRP